MSAPASCVIGAGVDAASGAAYDYPASFQVRMNEAVANSVVPQSPPVAQSAPGAKSAMVNTVSGLLVK